MFINEAGKECRLTKKAIAYYEEQGLIQPKILENGYRDFSEDDISQLKKIAVLRKLNVPVSTIQAILNSKSSAVLYDESFRMAAELEARKEKQELLQRLAQTHDWEDASRQLETLEKKQTILERLSDAFPGYYGQYVSTHFAFYLNDPIENSEQQEAFETILSFLDHAELVLPEDLREYLDEIGEYFDAPKAVYITDYMNKAVQNPRKYIEDNQEILEQYLALRQSDEFRASPAYRLQQLFAAFSAESGYNDVFIPAMKTLSRSYREYQDAAEKANHVFAELYPDWMTDSVIRHP